MMSNRIILLFLGIIFLIIIVLSSQKLSAGIRTKVSGIFPGIKPIPTVSMEAEVSTSPKLTPTPTLSRFTASKMAANGKSPTQTPDTGAESLSFVIISLTGSAGIILKRLTLRKSGLN